MSWNKLCQNAFCVVQSIKNYWANELFQYYLYSTIVFIIVLKCLLVLDF